MDNMKRERESEIKTHQNKLIKQGQLLRSDIEGAPQHPKIPLELELNEQQLLHGDIETIKNFDHDMTISNQEKDELRAQFKELKFKKLLEKREQRVNEELDQASSRLCEPPSMQTVSKYSKNAPNDAEADAQQELEHILSTKDQILQQGKSQESRSNQPF